MRYLLLIVCFCPALVCQANDLPPTTEIGDNQLDFTVRFDQNKTDFDYGNITINTTIKRIGVYWNERFGERLRLGLFGGYTALTQTNNPLTAGLTLEGYHAGVALHLGLLQTQRLLLFFSADYTYQNVDDGNAGQSVDISWLEPSVRLGAAVRLNKTVRLFGGANYGYIDGQERDSGTTNQTIDFEHRRRSGGFFGVDLNVGDGGYIGIAGRSGVNRSAEIYFKKLF